MKTTIILALATLVTSSLAEAREKIGNGGGGYACKSPNGEIHAVYLLDLFEGSLPLYPRIKGYQYRVDKTNVEAEILRALTRASVNQVFAGELAKTISLVQQSKMLLPKPARLEFTEDAFPEVHMGDCEFVQIANYVLDEGQKNRVDIIDEYYSKMDALNQAALIIHEAVYSMARKYTIDQTSTRSRSITAMLLADDDLNSDIKEATADLIPDAINTTQIINLLNQCKTDTVLHVSVTIEGQNTKQGVNIDASAGASDLIKSSGSPVSKVIDVSCMNFKSLRWTSFADGSLPYYFTIRVYLNGESILNVAQRSTKTWDSQLINIR